MAFPPGGIVSCPSDLNHGAGQSRDARQEATRIALDELAGIGAGPRQRTQELSLQSQTEIVSDKRIYQHLFGRERPGPSAKPSFR
jgi:hypothetical protein